MTEARRRWGESSFATRGRTSPRYRVGRWKGTHLNTYPVQMGVADDSWEAAFAEADRRAVIRVTDDNLDAPDGARVVHDGCTYERHGDKWVRVDDECHSGQESPAPAGSDPK